MDQIVHYFSTIPSAHRSLILVGGIVFFWLIEGIMPLYHFRYNKWSHAGINIFFTITTILVNFLLAFILLKSSDWAISNKFGILQWLPSMPLWLFAILGLLLLDLIGAWLVHWVEHQVRWMWRFHLIHHTDTHIDTTSANRHHPGESIFRFVFTTVGAVIVGAPMWVIMLYQSLSALLSQFNHANITLPKQLDYLLSRFLVTPDMHKVHHHYVLPYTNSNYGNIFSLWDHLFGTYMRLQASKIVFGIDTHPKHKEHSNIINLLKIPFQKYREPVGESLEGRED